MKGRKCPPLLEHAFDCPSNLETTHITFKHSYPKGRKCPPLLEHAFDCPSN